MKKKITLILVCLMAGLTSAWAQDDLASIVTKTDDVRITTITNDETFPWILQEGAVRTPSFKVDKTTTISYSIENEKDVEVTISYTVNFYDTYSYENLSIYKDDRQMANIYTPQSSTGTISFFCQEGTHDLRFNFRNYFHSESAYVQINSIDIQNVESKNIQINLTTPGTLGTEVLAQASTLPAVKYMKLSGNMNSDDWATIKQMTGLQSLDMEDANITEIPANAFYNNNSNACIPLKRFVFPKTLKKIGASAFYHNNTNDPYLDEELKLPEGLEEIGNSAFYNNGIKRCVLPSTVTTLGTYVFYGNPLQSITLNEHITSLPAYIFKYCGSLTTINGIERITNFGNQSLLGCSSFKSLGDAKPITIGESAFESSGIEAFDGSETTSIGTYAFYSCKMTSVNLPKITSIGNYAFYSCSNLEEVTLSDLLTGVPTQAFYNCSSLRTITLGASTASLSSNCFSSCANITSIYCNAPTPPTTNSSFNTAIPTQATLYVPEYAIVSYKLDSYWSKFTTVDVNPNAATDVTINSSLELSSNARIPNTPNITLANSNSKLTVNGNTEQTINKFIGYYGTNTSSLISRCENMSSIASEARYFMNSGYWYFVCMPFDVKVSDIYSSIGAAFAIRYYDGASRASTNTSSGNWKNVDADATLKAGEGYIFRVSSSNGYIVLPATEETHNRIFTSSAITTPLNTYASSTSADANWNLVGNPYPCYYDIYYMDYTAPITVWNTNNSTYSAYSVVDDALALLPLQAFFVQKPDAITGITFQPLGRQHTTTIQHGSESKSRVASAQNRSIINLSLSNGVCEDVTRVVVNPLADDAYDANCDAAKMLNLESTPQLYTLSEDGTMYAINEGEQLNGEVQMGMWFPQDGYYTLSAPRSDLEIEIYDNGELVSLPYTFSAFEGTDDARFMMLIKKGENTGINSISDSADKTVEMFDLTGRRISNVNQKGVYIINNRKVIK